MEAPAQSIYLLLLMPSLASLETIQAGLAVGAIVMPAPRNRPLLASDRAERRVRVVWWSSGHRLKFVIAERFLTVYGSAKLIFGTSRIDGSGENVTGHRDIEFLRHE